MKWTRDDALAEKLLSAAFNEQVHEDRSGEIHLSDLTHCLTKSWHSKQGQGGKSGIPYNATTQMYFILGLGLESVLLAPHKRVQRGEVDGITCSIDTLMGEDYLGGYGEMKSTRIRADNFPFEKKSGNFRVSTQWWQQILGEMKVFGVRRISYIVLHLIDAKLQCWQVECTDEEVETNWDLMLLRKEVLIDGLNNGKPPTPFLWNEAWECENCEMRMLCEMSKMLSGGVSV